MENNSLVYRATPKVFIQFLPTRVQVEVEVEVTGNVMLYCIMLFNATQLHMVVVSNGTCTVMLSWKRIQWEEDTFSVPFHFLMLYATTVLQRKLGLLKHGGTIYIYILKPGG